MEKISIIFDESTPTVVHPNMRDFIALTHGTVTYKKRYYSIGGGEILKEGEIPKSNVETMYETGKDLKVIYRETSEGGLAKNYNINN